MTGNGLRRANGPSSHTSLRNDLMLVFTTAYASFDEPGMFGIGRAVQLVIVPVVFLGGLIHNHSIRLFPFALLDHNATM